ncbi:MAG: hypothetical protein ACXW2L_18860, partial [Burkholderiales bacterium]
LERTAQPEGSRRRVAPAQQRKIQYAARAARALVLERELVQPEAQADGEDFEEPEETHARQKRDS